MSQTRQHVHELIDRLTPSQLRAVGGLLDAMPNDAAFDHGAISDAPPEDEEIGEEEEQTVARSKEWFEHNTGSPFDEAITEMGLTMDEIRKHREAS